MLTGVGNKTGIKDDHWQHLRSDYRLGQDLIQTDKVKRLIKLTRIRARLPPAVSTQIAEGHLAPQRQNGREQL
jgi:hypothetical protein